ncbi:glycosyltransferase [Sphingobacterium olei]|uniref:Glycosyltransferase n=1 Tax=Sphingobacterium olei TaxID=2571155 RepID=A0A4U0P8K0_9SPHI|nr:glycosyltransferase family 4 protein [Sphingobacterium olei]TJZ63132.1 glycosyltransferase [Sphingobacterium olei]
MKIAYISTYAPRQCGIATFAHDILSAISFNDQDKKIDQHVFALTDEGEIYDYPDDVVFSIAQHTLADYIKAAEYINQHQYDVCVLEHEYGIFGGKSGDFILSLIDNLDIPLVVNLHTVLKRPSVDERSILNRIAQRASKLVVMSQFAIELLTQVYKIKETKILLIPHGVPQFSVEHQDAKQKLNLSDRKVIMTFGFIGRSKGIDVAIKALPALVAKFPEVLYLVVGKTHPTTLKRTGEEYRHYLEELVEELNLQNNVRFVNLFVDIADLSLYLSACDIYITPYVNEAQITSGTLSFAVGAGAAVLSTPYWHAKEMLAEGRGVLFNFNDDKKLAHILLDLFSNPDKLDTVRQKAYLYGQELSWNKLGVRYINLFERVVLRQVEEDAVNQLKKIALYFPEFDLTHIKRLTNHVGILQHAKYATPNYHHGYCLDDNSRAMLLALMAYELYPSEELEGLISTYLNYVHYMQLDSGKFRNFMSFSNEFLDDEGTEDSFGRTIWSLGYLLKAAPFNSFYQMGKELFFNAVPHFKTMKSVRAVAYNIMGVTYYLEHQPNDKDVLAELSAMAHYIVSEYRQNSGENWQWFEKIISYDNALLPLSILRAGTILKDDVLIEVGMESFKFLDQLIFEKGYLSIIGNTKWYVEGAERSKFGQQPIEVSTVILLYDQTHKITQDEKYLTKMISSFQWFLGKNELHLSLYDPETKGCCDGLESHGVNRNQGAESTICFWISYMHVKRVLTALT